MLHCRPRCHEQLTFVFSAMFLAMYKTKTAHCVTAVHNTVAHNKLQVDQLTSRIRNEPIHFNHASGSAANTFQPPPAPCCPNSFLIIKLFLAHSCCATWPAPWAQRTSVNTSPTDHSRASAILCRACAVQRCGFPQVRLIIVQTRRTNASSMSSGFAFVLIFKEKFCLRPKNIRCCQSYEQA